MDDVRTDVTIARPFKTDPCIFGVSHKYYDATFFIAACILMLTALVINVAHRYQRTRDRVEFGQSSVTIRPMFPTTRRNVIFPCATS